MKRALGIALALLAVTVTAWGQEAREANTTDRQVPEAKQTSLGLYVTAKEAYERWRADPDEVKVLDVRTPEEYAFVGHAEMARNVPLSFFVQAWDADKKKAPVMKPNPDFVAQVKALYQPDETILIICRSGSRSRKAVEALAEAGFKHAYNVIDGMEGDEVKEEADSLFLGTRVKNGWKNSGAPWTYELDPTLMYTERPK